MKTHAKDRWWTVPRVWQGETVFILAGGPSLQGYDAERIRGFGRVIVVNTSYRLMYDADILYFADTRWWEKHRSEVRNCFLGWVVTMNHPRLECVRSLRQGPQTGLSDQPDILHHGSNSGYQAINLAYLLGAKRIVLLGYDMGIRNGKSHWHGGHGIRSDHDRRKFRTWIQCLRTLVQPLKKRGVEVINCSTESALRCFPMRPLYQVLDEEREKQERRSLLGRPLTKMGGLYFVNPARLAKRPRTHTNGI